jgi:hypothetical protein
MLRSRFPMRTGRLAVGTALALSLSLAASIGISVPAAGSQPTPSAPARNAAAVAATDHPALKFVSPAPPAPLNTSTLTPVKSTAFTSIYQDAGGVMQEVVGTVPLNVQKSNGSWTPVQTTVAPTSSGTLTAANNPLNPVFGAKANAGKLLSVSQNSFTVSFALQGAAAAPASQVATAAAAGSEVSYPAVFPNTTLGYQVQPGAVKESLLLAQAPPVGTAWTWVVSAPGLSLSKSDAGEIDFTSGTGAIEFSIPTPIMADSSGIANVQGAAMADIDTTITPDGSNWDLTLTPSTAWLDDPARVYPVTIDPTLVSGGVLFNAYKEPAGATRTDAVEVGNSRDPNDDYWRTDVKFNYSSINSKDLVGATLTGTYDGSGTTTAQTEHAYAATCSTSYNCTGTSLGSLPISAGTSGHGSLSGTALGTFYSAQMVAGSTGARLELTGSTAAGSYTYKQLTTGMTFSYVNYPSATNTSPTNGQTNQPTTPTLKVTGVDPTGAGLNYQYLISTDPSFPANNTWTSPLTSSSTYLVPSTANVAYNATYYWKAQVSDEYQGALGNTTKVFSSSSSFTTTTQTGVVGTAGVFVPSVGVMVNSTAFTASTPQTLQVGGTNGIPTSGVSAVEVTVNAAGATGSGQVMAGPAGGTLSDVMQYGTGGASNSAVVTPSSSGQIQIQTTSNTNITVDVQGYYTAGNGVAAAGGYSPVAQSRIVDTTTGLGLPHATIGAGQTVTVQVTGQGNVPAGSQAAFVNLQVDNTNTTPGYVDPYATSTTPSGVALNFGGVPYTSIGAIVPLNAAGQFDLYLSTGNTINLAVDVEGYFTAGSSNGTFTPAIGNAYDSRIAPQVAVKPGQTITVPIAGTNGLPNTSDGLSAAVVSVTAIDSGTAGGHALAYADGTVEPSNVSTVAFNGDTRTNLATVPVGLDGAIEIHNVSTDSVNYVVNIEGFYQNTASTMCTNDTDTIQGEAASSGATIGASDDDPVLSAVLTNSLANDVQGSIYVVDSSGNAVDGSPTATGDIDSGSTLTFHVPPEDLTVGATYSWWVHAAQNDGCATQATSPTHTFTVGAAQTMSSPSTSTALLTGSALTVETAPAGSADCAGLPCALTTGSISVGSDGTTSRVAAIKADLSSIPSGATIESATLNLTSSSCFGATCNSGTLNVAESPVDVTTASTGFDLANINTDDPLTFGESPTTTSFDITSIVQDWYDGGNNFGAVLSESNASTDATGETFFNPSSATSPASISITYVAPTTPSAVQSLTVTPGDGGLIAAWADPTNTGWYDPSGSSTGITNYTASVTDSSGAVLTTKTVSQPDVVFGGLTNGSSYTVSVTANNPLGAGSMTQSAAIQPAAVQNGPTPYVTAVQNLVTAEDALSSGSADSTTDATATDTDAAAIQPALGIVATAYESDNTQAASANQTDVGDRSTLSDTIAVQSGSTVTLYTTVNETYTTDDMSTGTEVDQPGASTDYMAFSFYVSGSTITFAQAGDEGSLLAPITEQTDDTAVDAATAAALGTITDPTQSAETSGQNGDFSVASKVLRSSTNLNSMVEADSGGYTGNRVNLGGVVKWAKANWNGGWNGFSEGCTDFVSRSLHFGGGQTEVYPPAHPGAPHISSDPNVWYDDNYFGHNLSYSHTWGQALYNADYEISHGGSVQTSRTGVKAGWVAYVSWNGGRWGTISHAAVVTDVTRSNIYVSQHDHNRLNEPIYRVSNHRSWKRDNPYATIWYVNPTNV